MTNNGNKFKTCTALGCSNKDTDSSDVYFFPFPIDSERCLQWLLMCNRRDLISCTIETLNSNYFVCSEHFHSNSFVKNHKKLLKASSVPTLHIGKESRNLTNDNTCSIAVQDDHSFQDLDDVMPLDSDNSTKVINLIIETPKISLNICRLCSDSVIETSYMLNILENPNVLNQINLCLPIKISPMDTLPKCICSSCYERLKIHFEFHQVVMESENILKEMFTDSNKNSFLNDNTHNIVLENSQFVITDMKDDRMYTEVINNKQNENNVLLMIADDNPDQSSYETNSDNLLTIQIENKNEKIITSNTCEDELLKSNTGFIVQNGNQHSFFDSSSNICGGIEIQNEVSNCDIVATKSTLENTEFYKYEKNQYICSICNKKFTSEHRLELHIKFHMDEKPGICMICNKKFPNENLLYRHLWYLHGGGRKNNLNSTNQNGISEYKILPSSGGKCSTCGKSFVHTAARLAHEEAQHSIKRECYQCFMCSEAFATDDLMVKHHLFEHSASIQLEHVMKPITITRLFQCEYCFKLYTKTSALGDHRHNVHSQNPVFSCRFCNEKFIHHNDLLSHIASGSKHPISHFKEDYPERPVARKFFCCHYCSKMYQSLKNMMDHQLRHKDDFEKLADKNQIQDLIAGDIHQSDANLLMIPEIINGRSFVCNYCSKEFSNEPSLNKHNRTHTGEKPYRCDLCGKCFAQSSALTTHSKVHSDERPYSCSHCSQTFKIKGDRDSHEKKHSGQRPYKCNTCSKTFMTQHVYSQHRKIHTDERPYVCQTCNEAFRRPHVLKVHMLRHSGEKPHNCYICDKNFRQKGVLLKHLKKQHGIFQQPIANTEKQK